jgi:hypothetical protein
MSSYGMNERYTHRNVTRISVPFVLVFFFLYEYLSHHLGLFFALAAPFVELQRAFVCTLPNPPIFWVGDFAAFRAGLLLSFSVPSVPNIRRWREGSKWHSIIMSVNDERAMKIGIKL